VNRADRRRNIGRPWWKLRVLVRKPDGRWTTKVSREGLAMRGAKQENRRELGLRAGRGIVGYKPNK